jgi:hypothetical protein
LKSLIEWREYCKSGKRPDDIPSNPERAYAKHWAGMGDWLGTGTVAPQLHQYRTFKAARAFARSLGLKSRTDWHEYCRSGKKPHDIPSSPNKTYAETGWAGMGDWLGTGFIAPRLRQFRSLTEARAFVQGLGLKSLIEWREYCKSGKRPADIPTNPHTVYATTGWAGLGDWLGYAHHESSQIVPGVTEGPTTAGSTP